MSLFTLYNIVRNHHFTLLRLCKGLLKLVESKYIYPSQFKSNPAMAGIPGPLETTGGFQACVNFLKKKKHLVV